MSKKYSQLGAVSNPAGTVEWGVNDGGASKRMTLAQARGALPTAPSVISVGSAFSSTAVPTATLPGTRAADDILLLLLQSSNDSAVTPPTGYARLGPQNGIGAAATAGSTKLSMFWKRDTGSESAPAIPDTGDHTYGVMLAIRGCRTVGDPFHYLGSGFQLTATSSIIGPQGATSTDNCLVLSIFAHAADSASAQASGMSNGSLTSLTEEFDGSTTDGTGGGIVVISGVKANAGDITPTLYTQATSTVTVSHLIAFVPNDAALGSQLRTVEKMIFLGSPADLDDTWTKPWGARRVFVQVCDGGGSGSSGNTTTTAAGGGGGGGGGYDQAWYDVHDFPNPTVTVHAGKGGAATTALNQAGNPGVLSEFDKGGSGPLTSARRIAGTAATAAASADGGNGGCGSGRGTVSPAVATTRLSLTAATAGTALGAVGGRGGSGTTAPVGGSEAEWGGGGGESGADTDAAITSANNGNSMCGGGGGAGGRTNTNVSGSGAGGGAAGVNSANGAAGANSNRLPYGGSGGCGGGSGTVTGGRGGFPGGGGGGGAGVAGGFGGEGGHGCVVVTTHF